MVRSTGTRGLHTVSVHESDTGLRLFESRDFFVFFFSRRVSLVLFGQAWDGHLISYHFEVKKLDFPFSYCVYVY